MTGCVHLPNLPTTVWVLIFMEYEFFVIIITVCHKILYPQNDVSCTVEWETLMVENFGKFKNNVLVKNTLANCYKR